MLSNKARYALRALTYLAERSPEPSSIAEIADGSGAPRKFLEAILLELRVGGLLVSRRGRTGGYGLAREADAISIADILRIVDGPLALAPCASRTFFRACNDCTDVELCRVRHILLEGRDALAEVLERRTVADLLPGGPAGIEATGPPAPEAVP